VTRVRSTAPSRLLTSEDVAGIVTRAGLPSVGATVESLARDLNAALDLYVAILKRSPSQIRALAAKRRELAISLVKAAEILEVADGALIVQELEHHFRSSGAFPIAGPYDASAIRQSIGPFGAALSQRIRAADADELREDGEGSFIGPFPALVGWLSDIYVRDFQQRPSFSQEGEGGPFAVFVAEVMRAAGVRNVGGGQYSVSGIKSALLVARPSAK
jgi:hypothetical protein